MDFLNSKQRKLFYKQLRAQYGYNGPKEHALFEGGADKIYALTKAAGEIPIHELRPVQGGLYVASTQGEDLRLTMDGAMLFGPYCEDCFIDVDEAGKNAWMAGKDLEYSGELHGYVLVRYGKRILGCGSVASNGYVKNYVSKGRRITQPH